MMQRLSRNYIKTLKNLTQNTTPIFSFAKLNKGFDSDMSTFENVDQYYQDLQRFARTSERGILELKHSNFENMLSLVNSRNDIETMVQAYYNFIGHRVKLTQRIQDEFVQKAIQFEGADLIHDIIQNHSYLMYFPHPSTLKNLLAYHASQNDSENLLKVLKFIEINSLLKVDTQTFNAIFENFNNNELSQFIPLTVFRIINKRGLQMNDQQLQVIFTSISQLITQLKSEDKASTASNIQQKYTELVNQYLEQQKLNTAVTLQGQALLQLTAGQLNNALEKLAGIESGFQADSLIFQELVQRLSQEQNKDQIVQVLKSLANKHKQNIDQAIQQIQSQQQQQEQQQEQEQETEEEGKKEE